MNDSMKRLIELRARQLRAEEKLEEAIEDVKAAETDEQLDTATTTAEEVKAEIETIKEEIAEVEAKIAETEAVEEQKAEEEMAEQEAIEKENEDLKEEERNKTMNTETRSVRIETAEERAAKEKQVEERAKALKEGRSVTVASGDILLPKHQDNNLAAYPFQPVSSLVDMVNVINLNGGETYEKAFTKGYGTAGLTAEGADYASAEPVFDYATIAKTKVTAYAEVSEETLKLPAANYEAEIMKNMEIALKKKFSEQILNGAGTTNTFKGITASGVEALEASDVVEVSAITDSTLDEILYSFGGDEEVLGTGVLILNKKDLKGFATLRNTDGTKTYDVDYKAQTIDGIPYVINSNLADLTTAEAGKTCMLFGVPKGYDVAIFSPVEVMKSTDYKFKQGIVCYKASVFAGGNVGSYRAFVKVNKA